MIDIFSRNPRVGQRIKSGQAFNNVESTTPYLPVGNPGNNNA